MSVIICYNELTPGVDDDWTSRPVDCSSWLTWLSVMLLFERKYLPSLSDRYRLAIDYPDYLSRLTMTPLFDRTSDNNFLDEIWNLCYSDKLSQSERITLLSMRKEATFLRVDSEYIFSAWETVSKELGGFSQMAFTAVINQCRRLMSERPRLNKFSVEWNLIEKWPLVMLYKGNLFDIKKRMKELEPL